MKVNTRNVTSVCGMLVKQPSCGVLKQGVLNQFLIKQKCWNYCDMPRNGMQESNVRMAGTTD